MKLTVKLTAPYRRKEDPEEFVLEAAQPVDNLNELARYLFEKEQERFAFPLIDKKGIITAEFMINGRHQPLKAALKEGDHVTVIPYIGGG